MIDCHVHVFDPARFPYTPDTWYTPAGGETGTAAQLTQVMDAHGVRRALLVGPNSGYGLDNRCLLDAIKLGAGRFKGVAVARNDASCAELQDLQAQGVVGVALNVALLGVDFYQGTGPLLERLRELGLWAQVQIQGDQLVDLKPMLLGSGAKLLFDHCGRPGGWCGAGGFCGAAGAGRHRALCRQAVQPGEVLNPALPVPGCLVLCAGTATGLHAAEPGVGLGLAVFARP